jgi:hypothetical protein
MQRYSLQFELFTALLLKLQITENETTLFSEVGYGYEW